MTYRRAVADAMAMKTVKSTKNLTFQAWLNPRLLWRTFKPLSQQGHDRFWT